MRELQKLLDKYKKEKDTLDKLTPRIDKRRSELGIQIQAIEQLLAGSESIDQFAIPDEVLDYLEKHLPLLKTNGQAGSNETLPAVPGVVFDPARKTIFVLSMLLQADATSPSRGLDSKTVVQLAEDLMTNDDVYKVLSRQKGMGRLKKQDNKFHLTENGIALVKRDLGMEV